MIDWEKAFPIEAGISRRLLKRIGFTEGQIALVTDDDLAWMAEIMAQNYREGLCREDLRHLATIVLRDKEQDS